MSDFIEGYKYEIFISYRQNDNKYDGWVTEFVANLKKELEATIKDKLAIFFDENPVDGLLETYSVEQSIEEKIKCLIFIPVISQTYCDTNSYAWQNEFRVFNKFSKEDRFGREIRLTNGSVASRLLPVKIHEIDPEDKALLEHEFGGVLRCIDFIYRSAGVNRPLRASEDHPLDNLNKIFYRDQINKVANAIKEIITVLKSRKNDPFWKKEKAAVNYEAVSESKKKSKVKSIAAGIIMLLLVISGFIYVSVSSKSKRPIEKSIAVLPFRNDSPSDSNTYFINGIMEEILNNLQKIQDLRIISRTSVEQYRNTSKSIPQIAKELGVNYIVEGSGQKYGKSFRLNVQLINARKENYLWGKLYEQRISKPGDIIEVQSSIAQSIVTELEVTITPEEKQLIENIPTTNLTAYDFYQKGKEQLSKFWIDADKISSLKQAEKLFKRALESDPKFAQAIVGQAEVLWNKHIHMDRKDVLDSVLMLTDIALSYNDKIAEAYVIKGWCYDEAGLADKAFEVYSKAIDLNPNDWKGYFGLAELYDFADPVKSLFNLQKAASLTHGAAEMPTLLRHIGGELLVTGFIEKSAIYFARAFELDGDSAIYLSCLGGIEYNQGNFDKAIQYYQRAYMAKKNYTEVIQNLALCYQLTGNNKESMKYYKELESQGVLNYNLHRVGYTYWENGLKVIGNKYINMHIEHCNSVLKTGRRPDLIAYTYYDLAGISAFKGENKKSYQYLRMSNQGMNCFTYMIILIKNDPLFNRIKNEDEFQEIIREMELKYTRVHNIVGKWIDEQEGF